MTTEHYPVCYWCHYGPDKLQRTAYGYQHSECAQRANDERARFRLAETVLVARAFARNRERENLRLAGFPDA